MQITEHIHAIRIPFQVTSPTGAALERFVYATLVVGEKICLIDTGVASSERLIFDALKKLGRSSKDISMTVLTHSHPDHIGAAPAVKRASGCVMAAHGAERSWMEDVALQARERPVPGFDSLVEGPVRLDYTLEDGDVLDFGEGVTLEVRHTPGHSKGSISLWLKKDRALFTADAVPIPGEMPIYEDAVASAESIRKLMGFENIEVLLSAWDEPRRKEEATRVLEKGLAYLQRIHKMVLKAAGEDPSLDPMALCRVVLERLGLPGTLANPLIARSFQAHLRARALMGSSLDF